MGLVAKTFRNFMKKTYLFLVQALLALSLAWATGCSKNDDNGGGESTSGVNKPPTCSITNPKANAQFNMDENIPVTVVAEDADGTIAEVQLYIDDVGYSLIEKFPYNSTINAGELNPGSHTLKAVAKDDQGAKGEATVNIVINQPSTESPDFVSFSDGKIPSTWQTTAWKIDNTVGYDDIYSLKADAVDVAVVTNKTFNENINFVEFYLYGFASFYIDGTKVKECIAGNGWTKFGFYLSEGLHTLKWQSTSTIVNLDAIHFKKETQLAVGTYYQGGIIAYLDNTKQHGLIAAPEDQSTGIQWYNGSYIDTGATGTIIGAGKSNTTAIVQAQGLGVYAAKLCDDLVLNGYSDWFLPSKDELNMLYQNRDLIGGFNTSYGSDSYYWSSSEINNNNAWYQSLFNGVQYNYYDYTKNSAYRVRAVRAF